MKTIISINLLILLLFIKHIIAKNYDANWMSLLNPNLKLNEINIPGTHDSGTYNVAILKSEWAQTQNLNIKEQLELGIRYLDIRLALDDDDLTNIYLSHDNVPCYESKIGYTKLYLTKVLDYCIEFLRNNESREETIILHLKREHIKDDIKNSYNDDGVTNTYVAKILNDILSNYKYYYKIYYIYDEDSTIPKIGQVRGRIVIITREKYEISDNNFIGYQLAISDMGNCYEYNNNGDSSQNDGEKCYPIISSTKHKGIDYRYQDNYNLEKDDKWDIIYDVLTNNTYSRSSNDDDASIITDNSKYYNTSNNNVLTINFMNIARASNEKGKGG